MALVGRTWIFPACDKAQHPTERPSRSLPQTLPTEATESPSQPESSVPCCPWDHLRRLDELPECDRSLSRPATMAFHVFPLSSLWVTPWRKYTARSSQPMPQTWHRDRHGWVRGQHRLEGSLLFGGVRRGQGVRESTPRLEDMSANAGRSPPPYVWWGVCART